MVSVNELVSVWLFVFRQKLWLCAPLLTHTYPLHIEPRDWRHKCVNASVNQFLSRNNQIPKIMLLGKERWAWSFKHLAHKYVKICQLNSQNYYVSVHTFHSCCAIPSKIRKGKKHVTMLCSKNGSSPNCTLLRITKDNIKLIIKCSWVSA